MDSQLIHTSGEYKAALKRLSVLIDADPKRETPEAIELEQLGLAVQAYEAQHFPLDLPHPNFRENSSDLDSSSF